VVTWEIQNTGLLQLLKVFEAQDIVEAVLMCIVNVGLKLQHYKIEYHIIHELMSVGPADESLHKQNQDLIESRIHNIVVGLI